MTDTIKSTDELRLEHQLSVGCECCVGTCCICEEEYPCAVARGEVDPRAVDESLIPCIVCGGSGQVMGYYEDEHGQAGERPEDCDYCHATGYIDNIKEN